MIPTLPKHGHFAALDGLRGIACLLILLWHLVWVQIGPPAPAEWGLLRLLLSQTWSGVDLFFVLSGFLILHSLLDREEKGYPMASFFQARAFRLIPVYFFLLIACAVGRNLGSAASPFISFQQLHSDRVPLWTYACFGQSWYLVLAQQDVNEAFGNRFLAVTWSLAAEVEYYVGAALLLLLVARKQRILTLLWFALGALLIRAAITLYLPLSSAAAYVLPPARMDGFAWGGLVACALRYPAVKSYLQERIAAILAICLLLGAGVALLTLRGSPFSGGFATNFSYGWFALFYAACVTWVVLRSAAGSIGFLARGPLAWLGTISYSVFLFHCPLHSVYSDLCGLPTGYIMLRGGLWYFLGEIAVILGFGAASYWVIERPFIAFGRRLGAARRPAAQK